MNAVLNSNSSSAIVSAIDSVKPYNPFVYSLGKKSQIQGGNVPAHARTSVRSNPQSSIAFSTATDFKIIRGGMLENAILRLEFTVASSAVTVSGTFFNDICERIQLISSGRVIQETTPFGRMCLLSQRPKDVRDNLTDLMQITNGNKTLTVGTHVAYIPCMFSHFESCELHINDLFCEPIMVRLRSGSVSDYMAAGSTASNLSFNSSGCYLQQIHRTLPSALEQAQIAENFGDQEALIRVQNEFVVESTTTNLSSETELSHTVDSNRAPTRIFVAVDDLSGNQDTSLHRALDNIKIEGNGQEIINLDADMLKYGLVPAMDAPNAPYGAGGGNDTLPCFSNILCYNLGYTSDNSHYTNLNSLREINTYKVTVNLGTADSGNHRLRVALQCPVLESISSASGKITTSLSS